ncbi:MAG TPA: DivIVA domain-containing protein [Mycobacteriales bacterium]|nr:DivIVA domain-containing protein [Mycobacteriales bacterium]
MRAHEAMRRVPDALDELVALVESARGLPLSASCVVPREEVLDLLDELRAALPDALEEARGVLAAREELLGQARDRRDQATGEARTEADRLLTGARAEADRVLAAARADAERMVSADGVRRAAQAEARGVLEAARARADRLRADADAYADARLAALEDTLSRLLGTVERGRDLLRRPADGAAPADLAGPGAWADADRRFDPSWLSRQGDAANDRDRAGAATGDGRSVSAVRRPHFDGTPVAPVT